MEDINSAQDAALNNVETPPTNNGRNDFWKSLLRTVLGISIIETFANHLDQCADHILFQLD